MSIRQRLFLVLALGLSALLIAALAVFQIIAGTQASRERTAEAEVDAATQALADTLPVRFDEHTVTHPGPEIRKELRQLANNVMRPVAASAGGYCTREGALITGSGKQESTRESPGRLHPLSGDLEVAVTQLCKLAPVTGPVAAARLDRAKEVDVFGARGVRDGAVAWAVVRVKQQATPAVSVTTVVLAAFALFLVAVTIEAMIALGRGVSMLQRGAAELSDDLAAPVPVPQARELADVARGLQAMATRLATARDRERALADELSREQRLAALGRVAAGIAHEVRNPLAGMKLRLDLLKRDASLSEQAQGDVVACLGEVARLNRLVESLLTAGRSKSKPSTIVDLAVLADARVAAQAAVAQQKAVTLTRTGGAVVESEPDAIASALENLLRNAIEASPQGGVVVVRVAGGGGAPATVTVEDHGPGIPDARKQELFEPFFTTKPDGTGLGLWMSRLLLEARGASLGYDRQGDTTRMRIQFPTLPTPDGPVSS